MRPTLSVTRHKQGGSEHKREERQVREVTKHHLSRFGAECVAQADTKKLLKLPLTPACMIIVGSGRVITQMEIELSGEESTDSEIESILPITL